jgi:hypothetical protein
LPPEDYRPEQVVPGTIIIFFDYSHSSRCEVMSHCGLVGISLTISDTEHFFMYLLAICMDVGGEFNNDIL